MSTWGLKEIEMSDQWTMPIPQIGDLVLFSTDCRTFSDPTVGFVAVQPGDSTISIVTFTPTGYVMVRNSVHHRDDPALHGDHGWQDLGVWDFAPSTKAMRELMAPTEKSEKQRGREAAGK
jgi:hypothetical protein